ncbi:MAG: hypothetical protein ACRDIY_01010 [Chloroflexota bacterium]
MPSLARSSIRFFVALLSCLALFAPAAALADNTTAQTATPLNAANSSVSATLVGSPGGAYRYYQFRYQGSGAPVLVTLTFNSTFEGTSNQAFGFNLYGPSGLSYQGTWTASNQGTSTIQYTLTNGASMDVLVQVYNYTAGMSIDYNLAIAGLSGGSSTGIVAQHNTTPGQAVNISTINASLGGTLMGNSGGAYQYFTLLYPGGNSNATITMNAAPTYNGQGQAYGFNVYRYNPTNGSTTLVTTSSVSASDVNSETLSSTISQSSAGQYQLQVFNYWPGQAITFGINATGFATSAQPATGNTDAAHAVVLNSARQGATGSLTGNGGGAFNYYLVNYPGSNSQLSISVTYGNTAGVPASGLGFKVYDGSTLQATANAQDDGNGVLSAVYNYTDADAATFGIQVYDYAPSNSVTYTIYQVGSR